MAVRSLYCRKHGRLVPHTAFTLHTPSPAVVVLATVCAAS